VSSRDVRFLDIVRGDPEADFLATGDWDRWGTKEQNVMQTDLGVAAAVGKDAVEVSLPTTQVDIGEWHAVVVGKERSD
jgi:hypothetical protein